MKILAIGTSNNAKSINRTLASYTASLVTNADVDMLVLSFAEHNGSYTAAWKNLFDWASRIEKKVFQDKPVIYLSTSPGPGGAASVMKTAVESAPFFGAHVVESVSVPSFHDNYDPEDGTFTNPQILANLEAAAQSLSSATGAAA